MEDPRARLAAQAIPAASAARQAAAADPNRWEPAIKKCEESDTQTVFISIQPSIRRWPWIDAITGANALVKQYCATHPRVTFVDIAPQMIGADGKPRKELFVEGGLHMTPAGYAVWNAALRPHLRLGQSSH